MIFVSAINFYNSVLKLNELTTEVIFDMQNVEKITSTLCLELDCTAIYNKYYLIHFRLRSQPK